MKPNEAAREHIFEIIKNQMRDNNPPETNLTYKRLIEQGYDDFSVKQYIGQCVAVEVFGVLTQGKPFDEKRYIKNLKRLPKEPFD
ncbi:MAG: hypothetical protein P1P88_12095 [Bacteroidales bacterium]|nr:hypothetical protein [Bacteroidales bacterium]